MNTPSLDTVRTTLMRRGLPTDYVQRVVAELEDHQLDIAGEKSVTDENLPADGQRLGTTINWPMRWPIGINPVRSPDVTPWSHSCLPPSRLY